MILTTTNSVEGKQIKEYLGIVTGVNMNYQKGAFTFNMKKYYEAIGNEVHKIKEQAFQQLKENAEELKANAVVGINVDLEITSTGTTTFSVTGTAVRLG